MNDATALEELTGLLRAALDPYFNDSDPRTYEKLFAAEATYFDPNSAGKLEGDGIHRLFAAYAGQIPPDRYEILDPKVTLHADTAVFTFNLDCFDRDDGSLTRRWNATQVHEHSSTGWPMVHAHWSLREPVA